MLNSRPLIRSACSVVTFVALFAISLLILPTPTHAQVVADQSTPAQSAMLADYPADPPSDIPWTGSATGWSDVVAAFTAARLRENVLLGTSLPEIIFPAATVWEGMSLGDRALWLINQERTARGLLPLQGIELNVSDVAQAYAEYLLANNAFSHDADGRSPWGRLADNPTIGACQDFLSISENIYFQALTGAEFMPLLVEQAVYKMLYVDADSQWGHRHAILWTPYNENSGAPDREGFLGIGHARGTFTNPFNGRTYPSTDMLVMNFFDPCATWVETAPATPVPTPSPTASPTASPTPSSTPSPTAIATPSPTPTPNETSAPAQTRTVTGRVVVIAAQGDLGGQAAAGLGGVTVSSDDGQTTVSDEEGYFTLQGLAPDTYSLNASKEGYAFSPASITVDLVTVNRTGLIFTGSSGAAGTNLAYSTHLPLISPSQD